jgi:hypothetical protein
VATSLPNVPLGEFLIEAYFTRSKAIPSLSLALPFIVPILSRHPWVQWTLYPWKAIVVFPCKYDSPFLTLVFSLYGAAFHLDPHFRMSEVESIENIVNAINIVILGVVSLVSAALIWRFHPYLHSRLGKSACVLICLLLVRLIVTLRFQLASPGVCSVWIQLRGSITPFLITAVNFWSVSELFLGIQYRSSRLEVRQRAKWIWHGGIQILNCLCGCLMAWSLHGELDAQNYCILVRDNQKVLMIIGGLTILCTMIHIAQCAVILMHRTTFIFISGVRRMILGAVLSMVLLDITTLVMFVDAALSTWRSWKGIYFNVLIIWNTGNSLCAFVYFINMRRKSAKECFTESSTRDPESAPRSRIPGSQKLVSDLGSQDSQGKCGP